MSLKGTHSKFFILFLFFLPFSFSEIPVPGEYCEGRYCISAHENKSTSFENAQEMCLRDNSYLLELTDSQTKKVLVQFIQNNPGLIKEKALLNSKMKIASWNCVEPKGFSVFKGGKILEKKSFEKRYLSLVKQNDKYVARADSNLNAKSVLCLSEVDSEEKCTDKFKDHFNLFHNNRCYFSIHGSLNWFQAMNNCTLLSNATLATFHRPGDLEELIQDVRWTKTFTEMSYWIGCASAVYEWNYSNVPILQSSWFFDSPSSKNELTCSHINLDAMKWFKDTCDKNYTVLCMTDKLHDTRKSSSNQSGAQFLIFFTIFFSSLLTANIKMI